MRWFPVLAYHRVVETMPADDLCDICTRRDHFERQMRWLARAGYHTLSLTEAGAFLAQNRPLPPKHFAITFDDGYEDFLSVALPVLRELGFTATVFIVTDFVGKSNSWDEGKGCVAPLMTWDQIKEALQAGFSIGSHTVSHPDLRQLSEDQVWYEVSHSRATLEHMLGSPIQTFCYPYGKWSETTRKAVRAAGYDLACNDVWRPEHDQLALARTDVHYALSSWTLRFRCQRSYFALRSGLQRFLHPHGLPPTLPHYLALKRRKMRYAAAHGARKHERRHIEPRAVK